MTTKVILKPPMKEVRAKYKKAMAKVTDLTVPMSKVAIFLDRWNKQNFKTEGGKVGGWKPLKLGGRFKKGAFDAGARILQDTGRLRLSYLPFSSKKEAGIGSDLPYAKAHQEGFGPLPVRRAIPEKDEVIADVTRIFEQHTGQNLKKIK